MLRNSRIVCLLVCGFFLSEDQCLADRGTPWNRHVVDNSSRGADGVRVADVNGDGLKDFVTGWEEGGRIRVCLNPGPGKATKLWPSVTVGKVRSPEDAVFVDLDGDGAIDVVSCCEGRERTVFVHWAPKDQGNYLDPQAWTTQPLPASLKKQSWMYCLPLQVDGKHGVDLIVGSKGKNASIGWFEAPKNPRNLADWKWHKINPVGWIMSLVANDIDGDGDLDIVITDRKGSLRGCRWLENPGPGNAQKNPWRSHYIGGAGMEVMFLAAVEWNADKRTDYAMAVKGKGLLLLIRTPSKSPSWKSVSIPLPANTGTAKAAHIADFNLDGKPDIVFTCENSKGKSGAMWLEKRTAKRSNKIEWIPHEISGTKQGVKFDLIQLLDLDGDGDLDIITCEERDNLGVIWYENPTRKPKESR